MYYTVLLHFDNGSPGVIRTTFKDDTKLPINYKGVWDLRAIAIFNLQMYWGEKLPSGKLEVFELTNPVIEERSSP